MLDSVSCFFILILVRAGRYYWLHCLAQKYMDCVPPMLKKEKKSKTIIKTNKNSREQGIRVGCNFQYLPTVY